jgi:hypothetical protein
MLRRIFTILTMVFAITFVGLGTVVLVALGRGYSYDFTNHRLTLNGLLVLNSMPSGANVSRQDKPLKRKTPYRVTLEPGSYKLDVTKDGFMPWSKTVEVRASEVTWVQYVWMLSSVPKIDMYGSASVITKLVASRDHRHFAYLTSGDEPGLWVMDAANKQVRRVYTPKAAIAEVPGVAAMPAEVLSSVTWCDDNTHMLLQSLIGTNNQTQIVAINNDPIVNLTDAFKANFANISFTSGNWHELLWASPEGLRKVDIGGQTTSAVLADKVAGYTIAGDRILYIQATALGKTLYSMDKSGHDKKELVQSIAESDSYDIDSATYKDKSYISVVPAKSRTVSLYSDLDGPTPISKVISRDATSVQFNGDGRFMTFDSGTSIGTYDLENQNIYMVSNGSPISRFSWFDSYHLIFERGGRLIFSEYDGKNAHDLDAIAPGIGFDVVTDQRGILYPRRSASGTYELEFYETKN